MAGQPRHLRIPGRPRRPGRTSPSWWPPPSSTPGSSCADGPTRRSSAPSPSPRTRGSGPPATRGTPGTPRAARAGGGGRGGLGHVPGGQRLRRRRLDPHPRRRAAAWSGHKPSRGRVADVVPGWSGLSVEGVVTRTVADSAAILEVISHPDPLAWWSPPPKERPFTEEVGADPGRLRVAVNTVSALGVEVAPGADRRRRACGRPPRVARPRGRPPRRRPLRPGRPRALPQPHELRVRRHPGLRPRRHGAPQPGPVTAPAGRSTAWSSPTRSWSCSACPGASSPASTTSSTSW